MFRSKNTHHIETSLLICKTNQLTGFYKTRGHTERYFRTDPSFQKHLQFCNYVKSLSGEKSRKKWSRNSFTCILVTKVRLLLVKTRITLFRSFVNHQHIKRNFNRRHKRKNIGNKVPLGVRNIG